MADLTDTAGDDTQAWPRDDRAINPAARLQVPIGMFWIDARVVNYALSKLQLNDTRYSAIYAADTRH